MAFRGLGSRSCRLRSLISEGTAPPLEAAAGSRGPYGRGSQREGSCSRTRETLCRGHRQCSKWMMLCVVVRVTLCLRMAWGEGAKPVCGVVYDFKIL